MKDSDTQRVYWDSINDKVLLNYSRFQITDEIHDITLDSKIITSRAATRSIEFYTKEKLSDLVLI